MFCLERNVLIVFNGHTVCSKQLQLLNFCCSQTGYIFVTGDPRLCLGMLLGGAPCAWQTLAEDANLRPFLEEYEKRYEESKNILDALKLQMVPPVHIGETIAEKGGKDTGDEKDNGDDDDNAASAPARWALSNPPPTSR